MSGADGRPGGPFHYYSDLHGGGRVITADSIRGLVNDPAEDAKTIAGFADDLDRSGRVSASLLEGQVRTVVPQGPVTAAVHARRLSGNATYAVGVVNLFAGYVNTFDTKVADLNTRYNSHHAMLNLVSATVANGVAAPASLRKYVTTKSTSPLLVMPRPTLDVKAAAADYAATLRPEWNHARTVLRRHTEHAVTMFNNGMSPGRVRDLIDAGALPLSAATLFPGLTLTRSDRLANLKAALAGVTVPDGGPDAVAAWWAGLSAAQRDALLASRPGDIGNLDGVPIIYRDKANRTVLPKELAKLVAQRDALLRKYGGKEPPEYDDPSVLDGMIAGIFGESPHGDANPDYATYQKLAGLIKGSEDIQGKLDSGGQPPYYLIGYDPTNGNGHAIVSRGNPDTATNVINYVPGTSSNLASIGGGMDRSDRMWTQTTQDLAPGQSAAAITWYGYDAPQSIPSAMHIHYADDGRQSLLDFQRGMRDTHSGAPAYVLDVGHSYGTTLIGDAATHGTLAADRVAFAGSPGADADHADDLHLDGAATPGVSDRVWSTKAAHDPVPLYGAVHHGDDTGIPPLDWLEHKVNDAVVGHPEGGPFGPDPTDKDFGGHTFASDPGPSHWYLGGYDPDAHGTYWNAHSKSLTAMGWLGANQDPGE